MKKYLFATFLVSVSTITNATVKDSTIIYDLPDSVKAVQFMAEISVKKIKKSNFVAGIKTDQVWLSIMPVQETSRFVFQFPNTAQPVEKGANVLQSLPFVFTFDYLWDYDDTCRFLISSASDSAENFSLNSGYVFLPKEKKWKLIGTCRISEHRNTIREPAAFISSFRDTIQINTSQVWIQRSNGSWKNMKNETLPNPTINLFGHIDSVQQRQIDIKIIEDAIASGKTDVKKNEQGVYYTMMKEGTGRLVSVNDTVVAYYKGYLFVNDSVFDQTREKPATFPLKRLIRGWQIGVPLCRVGGKIKLVIPSDLAYSIRTRAAKIPPNSILVFEIEVLDAKSGN